MKPNERAALIRALASVIHGAAAGITDKGELIQEHVMQDGFASCDALEQWDQVRAEIEAHLAEFDANS